MSPRFEPSRLRRPRRRDLLAVAALLLAAPVVAPVFAPAPAAAQDADVPTAPGSDDGSGIAARPLAGEEVERLALLGRVWGFVKYHHPRVTAGGVDWDRELFRVLPEVLDAPDRSAALAALDGWLAALGDPNPCATCVLPDGLHLEPDIDWIRDRSLLGPELSARLRRVHAGRHAGGPQRYVRMTANVGNPDFGAEDAYPEHAVPDAGFRLLALYRFWNVVEFWFPYRDLVDGDWDAVLAEYVPRLFAADDSAAYRLEMMALSARITDTHANLWRDLELRPPVGEAHLPLALRFVEGEAVVTGFRHDSLGPATGLVPGDVVESLDGAPVDSLVEAWSPWYAASNRPARMRAIAAYLTRGPAGPVVVAGRGADGPFERTLRRVPAAELDLAAEQTHDLPGETFRMLDDGVAYLKLSSVEAARAAEYVREAEGADVLVVDIRNYPSEFVVFALGGHLVAEPTPFALFTSARTDNPGAFAWGNPVVLQPRAPFFDGTVVVLVDESSLSQAEYTAMAFRAAPDALVVGSTTAGADGNVSPVPLPGGTMSMITGLGVFYPDRTPTQRVGIVPDVVVRPTIAGIRAGRDEVLEAGVSAALGRPWTLPGGAPAGG